MKKTNKSRKVVFLKTGIKQVYLVFAILLLSTIFSCEKEDLSVISIQFDKTSIELYRNEEVQLTYTISPDNAEYKEVRWSSSDERIVKIDKSTEKIVALAVGNATITVTTLDGGKTASCSVSVIEGGIMGDLKWKYVDGTLTISGDSNIPNYTDGNRTPWSSKRSGIKTVILEDGLSNIGNHAFAGCSSLTSINLPNSIKNIGKHAFAGTSLKSIELPKSLTEISDNTFINCSSLESIIIPGAVTKIGKNAFENCTSLKSIELSKSMTEISDYTFKGCSSLESVIIPESITKIGEYVFANCVGLKTFTIPNTVISIGKEIFSRCDGLQTVTISNNISEIPTDAFLGCDNLTSIINSNSIKTIKNGAFSCCYSLSDIKLSNILETIESDAFNDCTKLKTITIPASVKEIGYEAFGNCKSLESVNVEKDNKYYTSEDGIMFNKEKTKICIYPMNKSGASYIIPNSVETIGECAFNDCINLKKITVPESVTKIERYALFFKTGGIDTLHVKMWNLDRVDTDIYAFYHPEDILLIIPIGSLSSYNSKSPWKQFVKIDYDEDYRFSYAGLSTTKMESKPYQTMFLVNVICGMAIQYEIYSVKYSGSLTLTFKVLNTTKSITVNNIKANERIYINLNVSTQAGFYLVEQKGLYYNILYTYNPHIITSRVGNSVATEKTVDIPGNITNFESITIGERRPIN